MNSCRYSCMQILKFCSAAGVSLGSTTRLISYQILRWILPNLRRHLLSTSCFACLGEETGLNILRREVFAAVGWFFEACFVVRGVSTGCLAVRGYPECWYLSVQNASILRILTQSTSKKERNELVETSSL